MIMAGNYQPSSPNKRLYNAGSEWQDEFSGIIDYFSTFYREYDPVLGRFNGVDPMADVTVELSIYHYAANNPVNFNDPNGDLAQGDFENIINKLMNSQHGGTWSSSTNTIAYFGDEEIAGFFGDLIGAGISFSINESGVKFGAGGAGGGGSNWINGSMLPKIIERYTQINDGDRNFKLISFNRGSSQAKGDINLIAKTRAGALLLAIIEIMEYKVE